MASIHKNHWFGLAMSSALGISGPSFLVARGFSVGLELRKLHSVVIMQSVRGQVSHKLDLNWASNHGGTVHEELPSSVVFVRLPAEGLDFRDMQRAQTTSPRLPFCVQFPTLATTV